MNPSVLHALARKYRDRDPVIAKLLRTAEQQPDKQAEALRGIAQRLRGKHGVDPDDLPSFLPPDPAALGTDGFMIGNAIGSGDFYFAPADSRTGGILFLGAPGGGKTTGVCHVCGEALKRGIGVLIVDLRGDYERLALQVPDALLVPGDKLRLNVFAPPPGVPLGVWMTVIANRFTIDLGLLDASKSYAVRMLAQLAKDFVVAGRLPTVPDFRDQLRQEKPRPRSSEEGYLERVRDRVDTFLTIAGEAMVSVEHGQPIVPMAEAGRLVVVSLRFDRIVSDFLSSWFLYWLYMRRLFSSDPFSQPLVLLVLDEQRSLVRRRSMDEGIVDIDLVFSRMRALSILCLLAEQQPSQVSHSVLCSSRLRLAFNCAPPELAVVAQLLGLDRAQAEELAKLPPGRCIARLAGDRISEPFALQIPAPGEAP